MAGNRRDGPASEHADLDPCRARPVHWLLPKLTVRAGRSLIPARPASGRRKSVLKDDYAPARLHPLFRLPTLRVGLRARPSAPLPSCGDPRHAKITRLGVASGASSGQPDEGCLCLWRWVRHAWQAIDKDAVLMATSRVLLNPERHDKDVAAFVRSDCADDRCPSFDHAPCRRGRHVAARQRERMTMSR